jgi:hypothetical protein
VTADPLGFVVRAAGIVVYFAGDTDLFGQMAGWGPIDVALLPIWGWGPTLGEGHLDPSSAVRATELLTPRMVVPVHWGTYSPLTSRPWTSGRPRWLDTPAERFRSELAAAGAEDQLRLLSPGGAPLVVPSATVADPPMVAPTITPADPVRVAPAITLADSPAGPPADAPARGR